MMDAHKHYTVGQLSDDSFAIYYQAAPVKTEGGTSHSLRFPALTATDWVSEPETALQQIADELNAALAKAGVQ